MILPELLGTGKSWQLCPAPGRLGVSIVVRNPAEGVNIKNRSYFTRKNEFIW